MAKRLHKLTQHVLIDIKRQITNKESGWEGGGGGGGGRGEEGIMKGKSHGFCVCSGSSVLYFNMCPTSVFQVMNIQCWHDVHTSHCVYTNDSIFDFWFEFIMSYFEY